jgi:phage shock protein E
LSQVSPCFSLCCPAVFHTVSGLPQPRLIGRARAIGILVDEQGQGSATKSVQAQALTCSAPHRQSGRQFLASHPSKADPVRSATSTKRILLCRQYVNTLCCIRFILKSTRAAFALAYGIMRPQASPVRAEQSGLMLSHDERTAKSSGSIPVFALDAVISHIQEALNRRYFRSIATALVVAVSVLSVAALAGPVTRSCGSQAQGVTSQEAFDLIRDNQEHPGFIILDVRMSSEYRSGHIEGALNTDVNPASFREELEQLSKNDTYLVCCRPGNRNETALCKLENLRFSSIYHLVNGITEWVNAGLPVSK